MKTEPEIVEEKIGSKEIHTVWVNMMEYGGRFVRHLGQALCRADEVNTRLIKNTWPEYWAKYLKMGESDGCDNEFLVIEGGSDANTNSR